MLKIGSKAPMFNLHSTPDQMVSLSQLKDKKIILLFYPADWSPVCSDELSVFNVAEHLFEQHNASVVAISVDSVWSHDAFAKQRHLHFPLLSDFEPKGQTAMRYNAYDKKIGVCKRVIYLIDEKGTIRWRYMSPIGINPGVSGVLSALEKMKKEK